MGCTGSLEACTGGIDDFLALSLPITQAICLAETGISDAFASSCNLPMEWEGEGSEEGVYATMNICCYGDFCCGNRFIFSALGDFLYVDTPQCERLGFNLCEGLSCLADDGGHCEEVEDAFCASNFTEILGDDVCLTTTTTASPTDSSSEDSDSGSGRGRGSGSEEELFAAALNPNTRTQSDEHIRSEKIAQLFGFDLSKTLKSRDLEKPGISMAELAKKFEAGRVGRRVQVYRMQKAMVILIFWMVTKRETKQLLCLSRKIRFYQCLPFY